jgi:hypothetical protein
MNKVEHMGFVRPAGRGGRGRSYFVFSSSYKREMETDQIIIIFLFFKGICVFDRKLKVIVFLFLGLGCYNVGCMFWVGSEIYQKKKKKNKKEKSTVFL